MQQGKAGRRSSTTSSTCSRSRASRSSIYRSTERRKRLEGLLDRRNRTVRLSETFDDGEALLEAAKEQRLEGIMAKRARLAVSAGQAHARLAEDQDARPAGVRRRRLHARARGAARRASASLVLGYYDERRAASTPATSAPASTSKEIEKLLEKLRPLRARRPAVPRGPEDAARCGRTTSSGSSRSSSPRSSSPSGRTTAACARRPTRACARTSPRRRCGARSRSTRRRSSKGTARAEALEPRQGLLAGRADHEGRSARVLPRGCAGARPAPQATGRSRWSATRRIEGKKFFQKDAPSHMPEWIPTVPHAEVSTRATPRQKKWVERSRSSTTSSRCCGW